jgi:Rod binding domain-containing protein
MAIPSINNAHAKVNPTDIPLEKLADSKALTEQQKTSEMTRQFEAVLLRQILNDAQKPAFKSKYASAGVSSAIYQDLMVNQLADKISSSRTVGLAQELETQVSRQTNPHSAAKAKGAHATDAAHEFHNHKKNAGPPIPLTKAPRL